MEKFFDGQEFTAEEINKGIKSGVENGFITPVFIGSAVNNIGVKNLMDSIIDLMPDPANQKVVKAKRKILMKSVSWKYQKMLLFQL